MDSVGESEKQSQPTHPMKTDRQVRLASTSLNSVISIVVIEKPAFIKSCLVFTYPSAIIILSPKAIVLAA